uniref:RadC-like JAB domain-containing protein n=1 Tax=Candidatus Kentrum sp. DK TaxID=2126562 RepID=A0A450S5L1_9GAMM|nr:MAG: conserved hypothetical protein (putative transposase or invertase) [Candidatus Kentron sp. DK]
MIPSEADKDVTDRLIQVDRILNIPVFDHLIITTRQFLSFEAEGLMEILRQSLKWVPPYEIELRIRNEELRIREEAVRLARAEGEREGKGIGMRECLREGRKEGMEMGREEGLRERRIEVARVALTKGLDVEVVAEISGLSEAEVRAL